MGYNADTKKNVQLDILMALQAWFIQMPTNGMSIPSAEIGRAVYQKVHLAVGEDGKSKDYVDLENAEQEWLQAHFEASGGELFGLNAPTVHESIKTAKEVQQCQEKRSGQRKK